MQYVIGAYSEQFGNEHVTLDVIEYVAEVMTKLYPSLRDKGSDPNNPTFVSKVHVLITTHDCMTPKSELSFISGVYHKHEFRVLCGIGNGCGEP